MAYIAPIHRPTSVRHAVLARLDEEQDSLIIAKVNRLEIWQLQTESATLALRHSRVLNGTISMLQKLRPKDSPKDILFIATERFQYFTVQWDQATTHFETIQIFDDVAEKHMRDAQSQDTCLVDPTGRFMAMHLWEGVLNVLRMGTRSNTAFTMQWLDQIRLAELFISASTFLCTETGHPKIAFLYKENQDSIETRLASYRLTSDDRDITVGKFDHRKDREIDIKVPGDPGAALLIPVAPVADNFGKRHNVRNPTGQAAGAQMGGVLVIGETRILYVDEVTKAIVHAPLPEATIWVARGWAQYDERHFLLADDYGRLHFLTIHGDGAEVTGMELVRIGRTSRASCLQFWNGLLFVGSHHGDSQLWRIDLASESGQLMELLQTIRNIGPILDFAVMDMGNREGDSQLGNSYSSGQARLVTGSGAHKDGSLRSVRSGVGLEDIGLLGEMTGIKNVFSVSSAGSGGKIDTLVVSFLTSTRAFQFDADGEVEELASLPGVILGEQTLIVKDLPGGARLQVTPTTIQRSQGGQPQKITVDLDNGEEITNCSANDKWLLVAISGRRLELMDIEQSLALRAKRSMPDNEQVSCVHLPPDSSLEVCVVGFWNSGSISLLGLDEALTPVAGQSLRRSDDNSSVPRELALVQVLPSSVSGPTLFVALEDGNVVSYTVSTMDYSLSGRKSVILGTSQARFHLLPQSNGMINIFATTEHPSLIYGSEGRIVYSAITAEDARCVCAFDPEAYPGCIAMATDTSLKISRIDTERQTHVLPLPMGETVRRIAYSAKEQVFGLGCVKRELTDNAERIKSSFRLVDEVVFEKLGDTAGFPLDETTTGATGKPVEPDQDEMVESVIRAELPDSNGNPQERFLVASSFMHSGDAVKDKAMEQKGQGRLRVLGVDEQRIPYLILCHSFRGECRQVAVMRDDLIVVALTKTVVVCKYVESSSTAGSLVRIASYRPSTYPVDIAIQGNIIAVGDLMKSLSLVEYIPAADGKDAMLTERARHYQSAWTTSIAHIEEQSWLEADSFGNLMMLRRNPSGVTLEDQRRMEVTSEMNLGEQVNRIRPIAIEPDANAMIVPKAFLATVEGAIYLFGTIAPHAQDLLMRFQNRLAETDMIETIGKLPFRQYRSFRNEEREGDGPFRFLDGELLERFLELDEKAQGVICDGLGPSVEDMRNMVEELRRMH